MPLLEADLMFTPDGRRRTRAERDVEYDRITAGVRQHDLKCFDFTIDVFGVMESIEIQIVPVVPLEAITRDVERFVEAVSTITYGAVARTDAMFRLNNAQTQQRIVNYLEERKAKILAASPDHPLSYCKAIQVMPPKDEQSGYYAYRAPQGLYQRVEY